MRQAYLEAILNGLVAVVQVLVRLELAHGHLGSHIHASVSNSSRAASALAAQPIATHLLSTGN